MKTFAPNSALSPVDGKKSKRHMTGGNLLLTLVGVTLFAWVIVHAGPSVIVHQLKALRIALPIVLSLSLCRLYLQTVTWSAALKNEGLDFGARKLIGIRLASQAMGYLTVFGPVLSEPMKIKLLRSPVERTATATFLDNGVYWFTSAQAGIAGCVSISLLKSQRGTSALAFSAIFVATPPGCTTVTLISSAYPAIASSTELSTTSQTKWCKPISPVEPMYIAGRRRTASRPASTLMDFASYLCPAAIGAVALSFP